MLTNYLSPSRYTYSMLSVIGTSYAVLTWLSQTLWMPIYPLCVLAEGKSYVVFLTDIRHWAIIVHQFLDREIAIFFMVPGLLMITFPVYFLASKKQTIKKQRSVGYDGVYYSCNSGDRHQVSLVCTEFQPRQGYIDGPCLKDWKERGKEGRGGKEEERVWEKEH